MLESPVSRGLFTKWVSGLDSLPTRRGVSTVVLQRKQTEVLSVLKKRYEKGSFYSISFDGWKSRTGRKLLGILCTLVGMVDDAVSTDFRSASDNTGQAETADLVVCEQLATITKGEQGGDFFLPQPAGAITACTSTLVGLVSDSASCNVAAKNTMQRSHPSLIIVACFAHQLNLLTGNILKHPSVAGAVTNASKITSSFSKSPKNKGLLEQCQMDLLGKTLELISRGETRWYSNYAMVRRLLDIKAALVAFGNKYFEDRALLDTVGGPTVVDLLRSRHFWDECELLCRFLRPIVVEIGLVERSNSSLSDVTTTFGRLYAYFLRLQSETQAVGADGVTVLAPVFPAAANPSVTATTNQLAGSVLKHL